MNERAWDILRWTVAIVSVAIVLAAASRFVSWLLGEEGEGQNVWRVAVAIVFLSFTGSVAITGLGRKQSYGLKDSKLSEEPNGN